MRQTMLLFGEAEKGEICTPVPCYTLSELSDTFGNPPNESLGLFYAIQALLYERELIYFRVKEEGYSLSDYKQGLRLLRKGGLPKNPTAICMPGVGDSELIHETCEICFLHHSVFITTEKDFYDYLMQ